MELLNSQEGAMHSAKRKKEAVKPPAEEVWNAHKQLLRGLYLNSTLSKLMEHMEEDFQFIASKNQYERKFKEWNFWKNITIEEKEHILRKKRKREDAGKETRVILHGVEIPNKRLKKREGRYSLSELNKVFQSYPNAPSPEGLSVATPPPALVEYVLRKVRVDNLPAFRLQKLFSKQFSLSQPSTRENVHTSPSNQILPTSSYFLPVASSMPASLFGHADCISTDATNLSTAEAHKNMVEQFRNATIERYEGEAESRVAKLFDRSNADALQELMEFITQFVSNDMLDSDQEDKVLDWISQQNEKFLESLFNLQNVAVQACLDGLVHIAKVNDDIAVFKALIDADKRRCLFRGRRENLLRLSIELNLSDIVKRLLEEEIDVNVMVSIPQHNGMATLLGAASHPEIARMLIDVGADINAPCHAIFNEKGEQCLSNAPVYQAAWDCNLGMLRLLLDSGAEFDATKFDTRQRYRHESNLSRAIAKANLEVVTLLLDRGVECADSLRRFQQINYWSGVGEDVQRTELQHACYKGETAIVKAMVDTSSGKYVLQFGRYRWAPLRDAAIRGHLDVIELLIANGADVNAVADQESTDIADKYLKRVPSTALMAAIEAGHSFVVQRLLSHGVDINATVVGVHGTDILAVAEGLKHHEISSLLRDAGANTMEADRQKLIVGLQFAAARNDWLAVQNILGIDIDPSNILDFKENFQEKVGERWKINLLSTFMAFCGFDFDARGPMTNRCALELAIEIGDVIAVQQLGDTGVNFNANDSSGISLLQMALAKPGGSTFELIGCMLHYGAHVHAPARHCDRFGLVGAPIDIVVERYSHKTLQLLLSFDASVIKNAGSHTIIKKAIVKRFGTSSIQLLLDHGAAINPPIAQGERETALQAAVSTGSIELVQLLLDRGADVNASSIGDVCKTALQVAVITGSIDLVQLLLEKGADINAPTAKYWGRTPLQFAIEDGTDPRLIRFLLEQGADINAPSSYAWGRTALQVAIDQECPTFEHIRCC